MRYRRFVVETIVSSLRAAFNTNYNRERQFKDLQIMSSYGFQQIAHPALVVEFEDTAVMQAGIGHTEWFEDTQGILRKWEHARFEGSLKLTVYALSTIDRDLLADAIVELFQFGRLDLQLDQFFVGVYGADQAPVAMIFNQLMLNTDVMRSSGNSATIAPWAPEDKLLYTTGYSMDLHGGFYNYNPTDDWDLAQTVSLFPYPQGELTITIPIIPQAGQSPFTNPFIYEEGSTVRMQGLPSPDPLSASPLTGRFLRIKNDSANTGETAAWFDFAATPHVYLDVVGGWSKNTGVPPSVYFYKRFDGTPNINPFDSSSNVSTDTLDAEVQGTDFVVTSYGGSIFPDLPPSGSNQIPGSTPIAANKLHTISINLAYVDEGVTSGSRAVNHYSGQVALDGSIEGSGDLYNLHSGAHSAVDLTTIAFNGLGGDSDVIWYIQKIRLGTTGFGSTDLLNLDFSASASVTDFTNHSINSDGIIDIVTL